MAESLSRSSAPFRPTRSFQFGLMVLAIAGGLVLWGVLVLLNPRNRVFFGWQAAPAPVDVVETETSVVPDVPVRPTGPPFDVADLPTTLRPPVSASDPAALVETPTGAGATSPTSTDRAADQPPSELGRQIDRLWGLALTKLDDAEQQRLRVTLSQVRLGEPVTEEAGGDLRALVGWLDQWWAETFLATEVDTAPSPAGDNDPRQTRQRADAVRLVEGLRTHWETAKLGLSQFSRGNSVNADERQALRRLSDAADRFWLDGIRDGTIIRHRERHIWFRLIEALDHLPDGTLEAATTVPVTPLELRTTPDVHRGGAVAIRGKARLGFYLPASDRADGIEGYYIVWVYPTIEPKSPVVLYLLAPPESFPPLANRAATGEMTQLDDRPIEAVGVFFKDFEYLSGAGAAAAPLILARTANSNSPPEFHGALDIGVPDGNQVVAIVIGSLIGAVGLVWWIWWRTNTTAALNVSRRLPPPVPPQKSS